MSGVCATCLALLVDPDPWAAPIRARYIDPEGDLRLIDPVSLDRARELVDEYDGVPEAQLRIERISDGFPLGVSGVTTIGGTLLCRWHARYPKPRV